MRDCPAAEPHKLELLGELCLFLIEQGKTDASMESVLLQLLESSSGYGLPDVVDALGEVGTSRAVDKLCKIAGEMPRHEPVTPERRASVAAIRALGRIGASKSKKNLVAWLDTDDPVQCGHAAEALGAYPEPGVEDRLLRLLDDEAWIKPDSWHMEKSWLPAAQSLIRIGSDQTLQDFVARLESANSGGCTLYGPGNCRFPRTAGCGPSSRAELISRPGAPRS